MFQIFELCSLIFLIFSLDVTNGGLNSRFIQNFAGTTVNTDGPSNVQFALSPVTVGGDSLGIIYYGDQSNCLIRQVNESLYVRTIIGSGKCGSSSYGPAATALSIGRMGKLFVDKFVADTVKQQILQYQIGGSSGVFAGNGVAGLSSETPIAATSSYLGSPTDIYYDATRNGLFIAEYGTGGNLYLADPARGLVYKVTSSNVQSVFAGSTQSCANGYLYNPYGVWMDTNGILFVTDVACSIVSYVINGGLGNYATGVVGAVSIWGDSGTKIYFTQTGSTNAVNCITSVDRATNTVRTIAGTGGNSAITGNYLATMATLSLPGAITGDTAGNLYFLERNRFVVRMLTPLPSNINRYNITTIIGNGNLYTGGGPMTGNALSVAINRGLGLWIDNPSNRPSSDPSSHPFSRPTTFPLNEPSNLPSPIPTRQPTAYPSSHPSLHPFSNPSTSPLPNPTSHPFSYPSTVPSSQPSIKPSCAPSCTPSTSPSSHPPTTGPSQSSDAPTVRPSFIPTTIPSTDCPTILNSFSPSAIPSISPTTNNFQSTEPSFVITNNPTASMNTNFPSIAPTPLTTIQVINISTLLPTIPPTVAPSSSPSIRGAPAQSPQPSITPTTRPTFANSQLPQSTNVTVLSKVFPIRFKESLLLLGATKTLPSTVLTDINLSDVGPRSVGTNYVVFGGSSLPSLITLSEVVLTPDSDVTVVEFNTGIVIYILYGVSVENSSNPWKEMNDGYVISSSSSYDYLGWAVSTAGDFNADGIDDIIVSAIQANRCYIVYGTPNSRKALNLNNVMEASEDGIIYAGGGFKIVAPVLSFAAMSLDMMKDINGDQFADIVIGSIPYQGQYITQRSYVVYGRNRSDSHILSLNDMTKEDGLPTAPTASPTFSPTGPSELPTVQPTSPTIKPTVKPNYNPSAKPSVRPSMMPTIRPTSTKSPTFTPTVLRTIHPTTRTPSRLPTRRPTTRPTRSQTQTPTVIMTQAPTVPFNTTVIVKGGKYTFTGDTNYDITVKALDDDVTLVMSTGLKNSQRLYRISIMPSIDVVIQGFDAVNDIIDLQAFRGINNISDVSYSTNPLIIVLPNKQAVILPSLTSLQQLSAKNFLFSTVKGSITMSSSDDRSKGLSMMTADLIITTILFSCCGFIFIIQICRKADKKIDKGYEEDQIIEDNKIIEREGDDCFKLEEREINQEIQQLNKSEGEGRVVIVDIDDNNSDEIFSDNDVDNDFGELIRSSSATASSLLSDASEVSSSYKSFSTVKDDVEFNDFY
eukprot:gene5208-5581_t